MWRRHHDHALNAGHLGGNGVHEHGGGILRATARHIDAGGSERGHLDAEHGAVRTRGKPALLDLALVELANLARGLFDRGDKGRIEALERGVDLLLRQTKALQLDTVKTLAVVTHRGIAVSTHVGHDIAGGVDDVLRQHALAVELIGNEALTGASLMVFISVSPIDRGCVRKREAGRRRQSTRGPDVRAPVRARAIVPSPRRAQNACPSRQPPGDRPGCERADPGARHPG